MQQHLLRNPTVFFERSTNSFWNICRLSSYLSCSWLTINPFPIPSTNFHLLEVGCPGHHWNRILLLNDALPSTGIVLILTSKQYSTSSNDATVHENLCCFHGDVTLSVHQICSNSKVVDKFLFPSHSQSHLHTYNTQLPLYTSHWLLPFMPQRPPSSSDGVSLMPKSFTRNSSSSSITIRTASIVFGVGVFDSRQMQRRLLRS